MGHSACRACDVGATQAEDGTSAGLDGETMSRAARGADEAAQAAKAAEDLTPVSYNYSFFHLVFALASMYLAMLMTGARNSLPIFLARFRMPVQRDERSCMKGWGTGAEERDLIDVGWFSVWVKFVTQWATAATYCWMLVAPAFLPDRQFV